MIKLLNIDKIFNRGKANEVRAIHNLNLEIKSGEFVVIVGANGSGKSTLLNLISGSILPTGGQVLVDETDVSRLPEYKRSPWVARVFQNPLSGTAADLSILDNFRLAALRTSAKKMQIGITEAFKQKVREEIATLGMGLENKIHQLMGTLSGGQRQALTLLMSVMDKSNILLLDEPTAALDPRSANIVMQIANHLIHKHQLTAVLITHNMKEAFHYGTRILHMEEGKVIRNLGLQDKQVLKQTDIYQWFE